MQTERVLATITAHPEGCVATQVAETLGMDSRDVGDAIHELRSNGEIIGLGGLWFTPSHLAARAQDWLEIIRAAHIQRPTESMLEGEKVLPFEGKVLRNVVLWLEAEGFIRRSGTRIAAVDFRPLLPAKLQRNIDRLVAFVASMAPVPAHLQHLESGAGMPPQAVRVALETALETGDLLLLHDRVVARETEMELILSTRVVFPGGITLAEFREYTGLNRNLATMHLDYWDRVGWTRNGDGVRFFSDKFQQATGDAGLTDNDAAD